MNSKNIKLHVENETIDGIIINNSSELPKAISIHGAGKSVKERLLSVVSRPLLESQLNILAIDFSGHGKSSGTLEEGSLKKRVTEVKSAINNFADKSELVICGSSMGGYIAIKLLDLYKVNTMILFCPAIYDKAAYNVQFNKGFSEIIRKHESWKNTDIINTLEAFTGNLLVIMGEKDEVIPKGVIDIIDRHSIRTRKKEIYIIPNCPHKIDEWIINYPDELIKLQNKINQCLNV